jgi:hypothetical protein
MLREEATMADLTEQRMAESQAMESKVFEVSAQGLPFCFYSLRHCGIIYVSVNGQQGEGCAKSLLFCFYSLLSISLWHQLRECEWATWHGKCTRPVFLQ